VKVELKTQFFYSSEEQIITNKIAHLLEEKSMRKRACVYLYSLNRNHVTKS